MDPNEIVAVHLVTKKQDGSTIVEKSIPNPYYKKRTNERGLEQIPTDPFFRQGARLTQPKEDFAADIQVKHAGTAQSIAPNSNTAYRQHIDGKTVSAGDALTQEQIRAKRLASQKSKSSAPVAQAPQAETDSNPIERLKKKFIQKASAENLYLDSAERGEAYKDERNIIFRRTNHKNATFVITINSHEKENYLIYVSPDGYKIGNSKQSHSFEQLMEFANEKFATLQAKYQAEQEKSVRAQEEDRIQLPPQAEQEIEPKVQQDKAKQEAARRQQEAEQKLAQQQAEQVKQQAAREEAERLRVQQEAEKRAQQEKAHQEAARKQKEAEQQLAKQAERTAQDAKQKEEREKAAREEAERLRVQQEQLKEAKIKFITDSKFYLGEDPRITITTLSVVSKDGKHHELKPGNFSVTYNLPNGALEKRTIRVHSDGYRMGQLSTLEKDPNRIGPVNANAEKQEEEKMDAAFKTTDEEIQMRSHQTFNDFNTIIQFLEKEYRIRSAYSLMKDDYRKKILESSKFGRLYLADKAQEAEAERQVKIERENTEVSVKSTPRDSTLPSHLKKSAKPSKVKQGVHWDKTNSEFDTQTIDKKIQEIPNKDALKIARHEMIRQAKYYVHTPAVQSTVLDSPNPPPISIRFLNYDAKGNGHFTVRYSFDIPGHGLIFKERDIETHANEYYMPTIDQVRPTDNGLHLKLSTDEIAKRREQNFSDFDDLCRHLEVEFEIEKRYAETLAKKEQQVPTKEQQEQQAGQRAQQEKTTQAEQEKATKEATEQRSREEPGQKLAQQETEQRAQQAEQARQQAAREEAERIRMQQEQLKAQQEAARRQQEQRTSEQRARDNTTQKIQDFISNNPEIKNFENNYRTTRNHGLKKFLSAFGYKERDSRTQQIQELNAALAPLQNNSPTINDINTLKDTLVNIKAQISEEQNKKSYKAGKSTLEAMCDKMLNSLNASFPELAQQNDNNHNRRPST